MNMKLSAFEPQHRMNAQDRFAKWLSNHLQDVRVADFSRCWIKGDMLGALVEHFAPGRLSSISPGYMVNILCSDLLLFILDFVFR